MNINKQLFEQFYQEVKAQEMQRKETFDLYYKLAQFARSRNLDAEYQKVIKELAKGFKFTLPQQQQLPQQQNQQVIQNTSRNVIDVDEAPPQTKKLKIIKSIDEVDDFHVTGLTPRKPNLPKYSKDNNKDKPMEFLTAAKALQQNFGQSKQSSQQSDLKQQIDEVLKNQQQLNVPQPPPPADKDDANDEKRNKYISQLIEEGALQESTSLTFSGIHGMESTKQLLIDNIVTPILFPQLFSVRQSYANFLLHSLPGCGKTFIVKCLAGEARLPLVCVAPSQLFSKWQGGSEKLVRAAFELARQKSPSILFLDEIDALCSQRKEDDSESSRRVKNEILLQLDQTSQKGGVTVIAATNLPFEIDTAVRRRFEKRIFVDLPDFEARKAIFAQDFARLKIAKEAEDQCAQATDHFSGADCKNIAKAVSFVPLQKLQSSNKFIIDEQKRTLKVYAESQQLQVGERIAEGRLLQFRDYQPIEPEILVDDIEAVLAKVKSSVQLADIEQHKRFSEQFGSE